jgi:hypothetical protein
MSMRLTAQGISRQPAVAGAAVDLWSILVLRRRGGGETVPPTIFVQK